MTFFKKKAKDISKEAKKCIKEVQNVQNVLYDLGRTKRLDDNFNQSIKLLREAYNIKNIKERDMKIATSWKYMKEVKDKIEYLGRPKHVMPSIENILETHNNLQRLSK